MVLYVRKPQQSFLLKSSAYGVGLCPPRIGLYLPLSLCCID